jgi:LssY C-terminus
MGAKGLFGLGALAFWLPEIALCAWQRQALNVKLVTFLLPSTFLLVYLLVSILRPKRISNPSAAMFAKRHHLRVWKLNKTYKGQDVWVAAATHDIATMSSKGGTKWTHRIDPHVDREREWVETDLLFIGTGFAYALVDRPAAPKKLNN